MQLNKFKLLFLFIYINLLSTQIYSGRSIFRPPDPLIPEIITNWEGEKKTYHFKDYHLEEQAIFDKFDHKYFMDNLLPLGKIHFRNNPSKWVKGKELQVITENFLDELYQGKTKFKDFEILKNKDFNSRIISGTIILKYKKYPFVLKLFIETPESFTSPFSKGWQPAFFFLMSGGINRYICGFTRLKNLEEIKAKIKDHPYWSKIIDTPRKWFWLPRNESWFEVSSKNIGSGTRSIKLPAIYGIITDSIESQKKEKVKKRSKNKNKFARYTPENITEKDPKFALKLSYYLENRLDPHSDNFIIEKGTSKVVIIDTEHFPSMVGLTKPIEFKNYAHWYLYLSFKCIKDKFFRHKKFRRDLQKNPSPIMKL